MFKKADIILILGLIITGLVMSWYFTAGREDSQNLRINVDGELYGIYKLDTDQSITINQNGHTNKITIDNRNVSMEFSDCQGQDCVMSHAISRAGEQIVCLPNKVVLEIEGGDSGYDAITR